MSKAYGTYQSDYIDEILDHVSPADADRIATYVQCGEISAAFSLAGSLRHMYWNDDIAMYSYQDENCLL